MMVQTYEAMEALTAFIADAVRLERSMLSTGVTDEQRRVNKRRSKEIIKRLRADLRRVEVEL